jgi:dynein heavy chain
MSTDNALVIQKSKRFSLLIDPEMQGVTWLKAQHEGSGNLYVLKQSDHNFKKMMEMAIEIGKVVIVEQVHQHVGMNLQSIMKK